VKPGRRDARRGVTKRGRDSGELVARPVAEEGEREVELLARKHAHTADAAECPRLPLRERFDCVVRQPESAEEP
jgi:hypothetical protein